MVLKFESDCVFVQYIVQAGWSELSSYVTSMSLTNVNAVHTVENNGWTFKERPLEKELRVSSIQRFPFVSRKDVSHIKPTA